MKKSSKIIVASLLLSCIAFTNVQAQDISQPTTIGFKGGISNLYSDNVDDENILTGFNADYMQNKYLYQIFYTTRDLLHNKRC
jgi:hypothetical protein